MNIYVDFDVCLCETGRYFSCLAAALFGKRVPYEDMTVFDMQKSFSLTDAETERLMAEGHRPEALLSYEETPGASGTVSSWIDRGYHVSVITGRPYSAYEPSRTWLDQHGLERVRLYFLDKYGRDSSVKNSGFSLGMEDYRGMRFDYAVEDCPDAFRFFDHLPEMKVLVYDRPWNRACAFPREGYTRCFDWERIREIVG